MEEESSVIIHHLGSQEAMRGTDRDEESIKVSFDKYGAVIETSLFLV